MTNEQLAEHVRQKAIAAVVPVISSVLAAELTDVIGKIEEVGEDATQEVREALRKVLVFANERRHAYEALS